MSDKKEVEQFYLDEFFQLLGEKPEAVHPEESPDFVVQLQGKRIGIEVTEYHSGDEGDKGWPRRLIEETWTSLQQEIMGAVKKQPELEKTSGLLSFKSLGLPAKREYKEFIDELIGLSLEMIKTGRQEAKPQTDYPVLRRYLKRFHLEKIRSYITWEWNHMASSIGLIEEELINVIKPKILNYRDGKIKELWLLIVSGIRLSQTLPVHLSDKLQHFHELGILLRDSEYDKVFIFQYQLGVAYKWPGWDKIGKHRLIHTVRNDKS